MLNQDRAYVRTSGTRWKEKIFCKNVRNGMRRGLGRFLGLSWILKFWREGISWSNRYDSGFLNGKKRFQSALLRQATFFSKKYPKAPPFSFKLRSNARASMLNWTFSSLFSLVKRESFARFFKKSNVRLTIFMPSRGIRREKRGWVVALF